MKSQVRIGFGAGALISVLALSNAAFAGAAAPTLPGATGFGDASMCFSSPCQVNDGGQAETSIFGVPLNQYGDKGTYTLTTIQPGTGYQTSQPNTPGVVEAPGVGSSSVRMNRTNPTIAIKIDRNSPSGGAQGATGQIDYWFEVVNTADPSSKAPVSLGVTATGDFSGMVSAYNPGNSPYFGDGVQATASLLITPGPGTTTLSETEQTNFSYLDDFGTIYDTKIAGQNSPNVKISFGPTSTFSGAFRLKDAPITVDTNTPYEVQMYATINGGAALDASVRLDPFLSAPAGYQISLSPGLSNGVAGVPEPSVWALLLTGFGAAGASLRRRRKAVSFA